MYKLYRSKIGSRIGGVAVCCAAFAGVAVTPGKAQEPIPQPPSASSVKSPCAEIDRLFKDFTLRDLTSDKNATISLRSFRGKKAVVLVFISYGCGTTWAYAEKIGALLKDYAEKDVVFLAVHSIYPEKDEQIHGEMERRRLTMPILDDKPQQALADYVNAQVTPTFVVLDKDGILRYKGAFDRRGDDFNPYLRPALDDVLAGKDVPIKVTRAFGCGINRRAR